MRLIPHLSLGMIGGLVSGRSTLTEAVTSGALVQTTSESNQLDIRTAMEREMERLEDAERRRQESRYVVQRTAANDDAWDYNHMSKEITNEPMTTCKNISPKRVSKRRKKSKAARHARRRNRRRAS